MPAENVHADGAWESVVQLGHDALVKADRELI